MNDFWVKFKTGTTADQVTNGLKAVPASNISFENDCWLFRAKWGTTQQNLNNLQGRIETGSGSGSVSAIGVQEDDDSDSE